MNLNKCNVIRFYEQGYIDQVTFFELVTGCGEQTAYEEGEDRLIFYLDRVANRHAFDYFILPYKESSMP